MRSSTPRSRRQTHAIDQLLEQRRMSTTEEALGGGRAVSTADMAIVHGRERRELAVVETMAAMMIARELPVTPLHGRTAALKQISAFTGDLLDIAHSGRKCLQRMIGLA